jgi:ribokinase
VSVRVAGQALVVTLGPRGVEVITDSGVVAIAGERVDVVDTTGAGDCFVGALAARLSAGDDIDAAARLANRAASLCVQRSGAGPSMPTAAELKLRQ